MYCWISGEWLILWRIFNTETLEHRNQNWRNSSMNASRDLNIWRTFVMTRNVGACLNLEWMSLKGCEYDAYRTRNSLKEGQIAVRNILVTRASPSFIFIAPILFCTNYFQLAVLFGRFGVLVLCTVLLILFNTQRLWTDEYPICIDFFIPNISS